MQPKLTRLSVYLSVILLGVLALLIVSEMYLFRNMLLHNAREIGMTHAQSYAAEGKSRLTVFSTLLVYSASSIENLIAQNGSEKDVSRRIRFLFERIQNVIGDHIIHPYAFVGNKAFDKNGRPVTLKNFDVTSRIWYKDAIASPGKTFFTGLYHDSISGKSIVSAVYKCPHTDVIVVFDISPSDFFSYIQLNIDTESQSFFFCDAKGSLLYSKTALQDTQTTKKYIKDLLKKIHNGELANPSSSIFDPSGARRTVCYAELINGWYIILTIPHIKILEEANLLFLFSLTFLFLAVIFIVSHSWRSLRAAALMERSNETVRVLGNSYLSLYRINLAQNTYEVIKGSTEVHHNLPRQGYYDDLMRVLVKFIEPNTRKEYEYNFSSEHLRSLVRQQTKIFGGEFRRLFGDKYRWVSVQVLFDKSLLPEVVLCFHEVEQKKQRQLQESKLLQTALEDMQQSEKAKQAFFNNMSHDMRTPTNAIIGMAYLARMSLNDTQKIKKYLDRIHFSGQQLKNLIDDILNLSHVEQGKFTLINKKFDLRECIHNCLETYLIEAEQEKKTLNVSIDFEDLWVVGDSVRIGQLLNNLLSNAFKFTSPGQTISFSITHSINGNIVECGIVVADTGIGMSEQFIPTIFTPYSRETRFSEKNISGTGLGMSIVKLLVESMNGNITVKSSLGVGTTFTITLPFHLAREIPAESRAEESSTSFDSTVLQGRHILLAEDNIINMDLATEVLSMHGMKVSKAWNGEEAVRIFEDSAPFFFDAILLDMQMPRMNGYEASMRIRAMNRPDAETVPIIAVTANAFAEDIACVHKAGMNMHVAKPIDFNRLFRLLAKSFRPS